LIQHNCILPLLSADHDVEYEIETDHILHRLRYPHFLLYIRELIGETHELYMETLLEHGRLRSQHLHTLVSHEYGGTKSLENVFTILIEERLVESVPVGCKLNRNNIFRGKGKDREMSPAPGIEQQSLDQLETVSRVQKKISRAAGEVDADTLWRVNANEFIRRFRHIACATLVREKLGESAGRLLQTMLEISRGHEGILNEERSTPVCEADILNFSHGQEGNSEVVRIESTLENLSIDTSELISCVGDSYGHATYCVNMRRIIDLIRIKEIEAIVRERFGGPACRIFRLLLLKRNLEQKQIAEMAMIPVKDTRELLYKLLKSEYVRIQEVARTSDHAPSRTFYLWRVDLLSVVEQVGRELYHATSNLRARLMHELSLEKDTLMLLESAQDKSKVPLTAVQRQNLMRMRTIATRLESSVLRLDKLVLIFNVF
jgi:DNA-directed RNA polymerase III subunit RPC3